jgi:peptidyl-prolyl cis-trans isomerase B (cyclophilin B)
MKTLPILALFIAVILAACGGGAEATLAPTETAAPTQIPKPTGAPTDRAPAELLADIKITMAELESFSLEGTLVIKTTEDSDSHLISMEMTGSGYVDGDNQVTVAMDIATEGFVGKVTTESREVAGFTYTKNPLTEEWLKGEEVNSSETSEFVPENMVATEAIQDVLDGLPVYRVTGTVPDETENELMILWVGTEDLLVRQIRQEGQVSAEDYVNFGVGESENLYQSFVTRLSNLNEPVEVTVPPTNEATQPAMQWTEPPAMTIDPTASYVATMRTNTGNVVIELFAIEAPETVNSFIFLATEGFYDGVIFHRVIQNFMIQGGDPAGVGSGGAGYFFNDEFDSPLVFDQAGILAMANSGPNTNSSQFFITTVPTPHLNGLHTIFGQVIEGQDVVDAISLVATAGGDRPAEPVVILGVDITQ